MGSFLYKSEIFLHYCQPGALKRRERETEGKKTQRVLTCAFDLLESESRSTRCAHHQDKEEPIHFFSRGNQKEETEEKCFEIYKEVCDKTEYTMKILNINLRVICSFPPYGHCKLWFTFGEQKGFFISSLWGLTCGTRASGSARTRRFCHFPFILGDANNIPQDAAVPTAFQCNSYRCKNLALLILQ